MRRLVPIPLVGGLLTVHACSAGDPGWWCHGALTSPGGTRIVTVFPMNGEADAALAKAGVKKSFKCAGSRSFASMKWPSADQKACMKLAEEYLKVCNSTLTSVSVNFCAYLKAGEERPSEKIDPLKGRSACGDQITFDPETWTDAVPESCLNNGLVRAATDADLACSDAAPECAMVKPPGEAACATCLATRCCDSYNACASESTGTCACLMSCSDAWTGPGSCQGWTGCDGGSLAAADVKSHCAQCQGECQAVWAYVGGGAPEPPPRPGEQD